MEFFGGIFKRPLKSDINHCGIVYEILKKEKVTKSLTKLLTKLESISDVVNDLVLHTSIRGAGQ